MKMPTQFTFATLAALLGLAATSLANALELPGPVVSPAWLAQHPDEVNIVDVRSDLATFTLAPTFTTTEGKKSLTTAGGHIPGALLLDFGKTRVSRMIDNREIKWMLPEQKDFQSLLRGIGVKAGRPTVIVSDGASGEDFDMAARVYWSMKVYGDDHLAVLDGGTRAWLQGGMPFATTVATPVAGNWAATAPRLRYVASSADVAAAIGTDVQIVDARPTPFYLGLTKKPVVGQAGHIKGAVNFPPDLRTLSKDDGTHLLSPAEYTEIFKHLDMAAQKPSITYCNTGHLAAGAWFVQSEVMRNPDTKLYDGSMLEWTTEGRPVVGLQH